MNNVGFKSGSQVSATETVGFSTTTPNQQPEEKKTLVTLFQQHASVMYEILNMQGDDVPKELADKLESTIVALCEKADNYGYVLEQLSNFESSCKSRKDEWYKGEKAAKAAIESLKERMRYVLGQLPEQSIQGQEFRFFLTKPSQKVEIDESQVPKEYFTAVVTHVIDRDRVESDFLAGKQIAGVSLKTTQQLRKGRPTK